MRHAIVRKSDGEIINSIDLDPGVQFEVDPVEFELVEGDWPIGWIWDGITASKPVKTPEELAKIAAKLSKIETQQALSIDPWMIAFKNMSIADAEQYIDDNVTDLASAKTVLRRLAVISLLLVKDKLR